MNETIHTIGPTISADGSIAIEFDAPRGLYQWSVIADGRDYDWEGMYFNMDAYGNAGQRTGPWDFNPLPDGAARPVLPAYWVEIDGKRIGLWFFQRVPVHDIAPRRFRGRTAFFLRSGGKHRVVFTPYRPMKLRWLSTRLEPDPEDRLVPPTPSLRKAAEACPSAQWSDPAFWPEFRRKLATTHAVFAPTFARIVEEVCSKPENIFSELPSLIYAYRMTGKEDALRRAFAVMESHIAKPHWGNPAEDGYSHNGDTNAAKPMRALVNAWHMLRDKIDEPLRSRMRDKLRLQAGRYLDMALLNRDYWGGSLLQDHGWSPNWAYTNAVLMLHGEIPEASEWISWAVPRMRRALAAMPRDGVIPQTQFGSAYLQVHELAQCRDTFLALSGQDLYDESPLPKMIDYLCQVIRPETQGCVLSMDFRDDVSIYAGTTFFHTMAAKHRDGRAAWLGRLMLDPIAEKPKWMLTQEPEPVDQLWAFFAHDPTVAPTPPVRAKHSLVHYQDSALVHFRDFEQDVTFSVRCGPPHGYHAHRHARGPCDRLGLTPRWGHFCFYRGQTTILGTPQCGYVMHTHLGSALLINNRGQHEDVGYPMSLPSSPYYGQEIETVEWDATKECGFVRLNLTPAYPDDLGVISYHREVLIRPNERKLVCRDTVALDEPSRLSWLFQAADDVNPRLDGKLLFRIGDSAEGASIEPRASGLTFEAGIHPTAVVHNYNSNHRQFKHVRYDAADAVDAAAVDFILQW